MNYAVNSIETEKEPQKSRGIPKAKEIFRFLKNVTVNTDGVQWILIDGSNRSYFTNLDSLFIKMINLHLHRMKQLDGDMVKNFIELLKQGWIECKKLGEELEGYARLVHESVRLVGESKNEGLQ